MKEIKSERIEVKPGDYIYNSYWHKVDRIVEVKMGKYSPEYKVMSITAINPSSTLTVPDVGQIICHATSLKGDSIMTMEEVLAFIEKYCCPEQKAASRKVLQILQET